MKRSNSIRLATNKMTVKLKCLVVVVASMMAVPISQADVDGKQIGDLEIYQAAEGGKVTITMMLDTSGSMSSDVTTNACDMPRGADYDERDSEESNTTPSYTRKYCETENRYFYRLSPAGQWYRCGGSDGLGSNSYGFAPCKDTLEEAPMSVADYKVRISGSDNRYYYKDKFYDRLTRLKDAIFILMDSPDIDSDTVQIGIGQYSTQSNSSNTFTGANGRTGKILVPAALMDQTQRDAIKEAVAGLIGNKGTPTANAYAEAGAYMLGSNTVYVNNAYYSGMTDSITTSKSGNNYISPLTSSLSSASCNGRGIYFLTDGNPNSSPYPERLMETALGLDSLAVPKDTLPDGSEDNDGMAEVGAFARALRSATLNPLGAENFILTAVVGFGSEFYFDRAADKEKTNPEDKVIRRLSYINPSSGEEEERDYYNCEKFTDIDAKNACNWGEKEHHELTGVGGFGEGGFYSAQSTEDIVNSVLSFVVDLNNTLPSTPSGTIIVPNDPYRADSQLAVAYYPTIQPKVADNAVIWEGNMKKYNLNEGTLYGIGNVKLFEDIAGNLDPNTQDLWSDRNYPNANDKVESGGFYAQLNTPATGISTLRTLYVEDWTSATNRDSVLRRVAVNGSGRVTVDNNLLSATTFIDTGTYNEATLRKLLRFLGFDNLDTSINVRDMTLTAANVSAPIKLVGATVHSTPASVSYSATLDADGRVTDTRDDYLLFGSTDGGLHMVDADDQSAGGGTEQFVIIPREMLRDPSKSDALVKGATKNAVGSPNFGIDAPWLVTADYQYDFTNSRVNIDSTGDNGIFAYGGLRMGGEAFYGIDINDVNDPNMMFSITPTTTGFERMGQIWSKPTKAKIKTSLTDTGTDVLVFGGGYDMCYENEGFQVGVTDAALGGCSAKSSATGNAVYIINAQDGSLIWSASSASGATTTVTSMNNSVVAGVTTLDRDNDGFMDHIYFADLGGQLFRADFSNAGLVMPTGSPTTIGTPETSFSNTRVTRVLQSAYTGTNTKFNYRFYERPVVSFYRNPTTNTLFALVNVISGDRSSPLSRIRDLSTADRLYGIIDNDITKPDNIFYASNFTTAGTVNGEEVVDLVDSDLAELPSAIGTISAAGFTLAEKNIAINDMRAGNQRGWYYPLTRFDGYGGVRYTKGIGKSEVIDSFLYTTVYNPDMNYGGVNSCSAKITGGSERQLYCLPYGICIDADSNNGTAGFVRAGKGIQELTLGPRSSTLSNQRLLIGMRTLTERASDRVGFGGDNDKGIYDPNDANSLGLLQSLTDYNQIIGDGTAPELIFNDRYTLQPKTWYEVD